MNEKIAKLIIIITLIISPFTTYADPPGGVPGPSSGQLLTILFLLILLAFTICMFLSLCFRYVLQKIRSEKRKNIWYMTITTLIFPSVHIYLELINHYKTTRTQYVVYIITLIIIGLFLGYFITPKKETT
jgi:membrane protease YdiL (CAAX protease family)